jgi:hypothetical protein
MVKSLILWVGLLLWALACLLWGLLTMFSPQTLQRFMEWYTKASTWSTAKGPPPVKRRMSDRVAGFFATLIGGWMAFRLLAGVLRLRATAAVPVQPHPPPGTDHHWSALVGAIVCVGLGVFGMLRPQIALRMTQANFPNRELSEEAVRRALQGGRVLGALTVLFGGLLLFLWYRWTH